MDPKLFVVLIAVTITALYRVQMLQDQSFRFAMRSMTDAEQRLFQFVMAAQPVSRYLAAGVPASLGQWWVMPRSSHWWEGLHRFVPDDDIWRHHFRVSRPIFEELCQRLKPYLQRKDTNFRQAVPLEKRVAIGLFYLGQGGFTYFQIGDKFAVGKSTAYKIVCEFCEAVITELGNEYVRFPEGDELLAAIANFESYEGLPGCCGAIDVTHVNMTKPAFGIPSASAAYFDRKAQHSISIQAVCDKDARFLDVYGGWPGSVNDARVFAESPLGKAMAGKRVLADMTVEFGDQTILPYLIGDAGYPLLANMIVPYPGAEAAGDPAKRDFNYKHSATRMIIEKAFGQLKVRWRILNTKIQVDNPNRVLQFAMTCIILHNMCLEYKEQLSPGEQAEVESNEGAAYNTYGAQHELPEVTTDGKLIRDKLAAWIA